MKRILATLALLLAAASAPAIVYEWTADIDRPAPAVFTLAEGETAQLACRLVRRGAPFNTAATNAVLYVQTNGMGRAWWTLPASVDGSLLRATVSPDSVPAASVVHAVIGASGPSGLVYRAVADLRYLPSPGYAPNAVQPPVRTLDFATVAWTNAPWAVTEPSTTAPAMDGIAASGISTDYARADHVHPAETTKTRVVTSTSVPHLPASAFPVTCVVQGTSYSAMPEDVELLRSTSGTTLRIDSYGICDFSADGIFVSAWSQAEDLLFGGEAPIANAFPILDFDFAVTVRDVPVATMSDLVAATNALYQLLNR